MKLVFCVFSYAADAAFCRLAVASIERLRQFYPEHEIATAIINDGNAPIPAADLPRVEIVKTTHWNRGGSLAGLESVRGQARTYCELFRETGADLLVKLDSDTLIADLEWLSVFKRFGAGMWGATSEAYPAIFGACYAITQQAAEAFDYLLARAQCTAAGEDRVFTRLAEMAHELGMAGVPASTFYRGRGRVEGAVNHIDVANRRDGGRTASRFYDVFAQTFKMPGETKETALPKMQAALGEWKCKPIDRKAETQTVVAAGGIERGAFDV